MLLRPFRSVARRCTVGTQHLLIQHCARSPKALRLLSLYDVQPRHLRALTTPPLHVNESDLAVERYHQLSDATMESLLENLENLIDTLGRQNYEVEYHSGVLTLILGDRGTYVINKQPPNKQIWLSSPLSGPKRYDYSEEVDDWIYSRDGQTMGNLLNEELSGVLGRDIDLGLTKVSDFIQL